MQQGHHITSSRQRQRRERQFQEIVEYDQTSTRPDVDSPGRASDYISRLNRFTVTPGQVIDIAVRVSPDRRRTKQEQMAKLDIYVEVVRQCVEKYGGVVGEVLKYVGSGKDPTWKGELSKLSKRGNPIANLTTTRWLRQPSLNKSEWGLKPTDEHFQALRTATNGVLLLTVRDPGESPRQDRSYLTKLVMTRTGKHGGRPRKCPVCQKVVVQSVVGQSKIYCSSRCRQKSYRERRRVTALPPITLPGNSPNTT